jgi:hypothetical protein
LADIFRQYGPAYRQAHALPYHHRRVMRAIETCRTPELGGVVEFCDHCQHTHTRYRSCRNGHCPKCQGAARLEWLQQRKAELLPTTYFHVVFTLPEPIATVALQNQKALYSILFRTASETLLTIAADPQHLGADIGFFGVLHTWGQTLHFHPHLHCVVPGGGLSPDHQHWIPARRPDYFLPVEVLSRRFRRLFLDALEKAYAQGQLQFSGQLQSLADPRAFAAYLAPLHHQDWVVYAEPPFGGPSYVLEYLARYTHRVAISNRRLRSLENGQVSFEYKDYRDDQTKVMTLAVDEFIRRFLQHIVPVGFQRIRYYGFLANCHRSRQVELCRQVLATPTSELLPTLGQCQELERALEAPPPRLCPDCGIGILVIIQLLPPRRELPVFRTDTS